MKLIEIPNPYIIPLLDSVTLSQLMQGRELTIFRECLSFLDASAVQIRSKSRKMNVVTSKKMICKVLREHTKLTLKEIAWSYMGGMDHASVIYLINQADNHIETERDFRKTYKSLIKHLVDIKVIQPKP